MHRLFARLADSIQIGLPSRIELREIDVPLPPEHVRLAGVSILHISDLHLTSKWPPALDRVIAFAQRSRPHLIAITGDFVESKIDATPAIPLVRRFAKAMSSIAPSFAVLGNHDGDLILSRLSEMGMLVLHGERVTLRLNDHPLEILGLPGVDRSDTRNPLLQAAESSANDEAYRIVLSHYPDVIRDLGGVGPHLVLAGHTHGGQVCLPGSIPIIRHDSLPREMCHGLHRWGTSWLHISRGVGTSKYPVRMFCPPEVTLLRLKA